MPEQNRMTALCEQATKTVTGIDFIQVVDPQDQTVLRVFFLIDPDDLKPPIVEPAALPMNVPTETIMITSISGGETLAVVPVLWATYKEVPFGTDMRTILEVKTTEPGDFSIYRFTIDDPQVDRFFNGVEFSFKQGCPSDLDCQTTQDCPLEDIVDFPVDYQARDFVSLRNALLDYATQRYPDWTEKIEADVGVMFAEVLAALGDEFGFIQDHYAREAYLETASQRRSLRRHTQLVDYHIHDGLTAGTWLDLKVEKLVDGGPAGGTLVNAGSRVWASTQGTASIPFEIGEGLSDQRMTLQTLFFSVDLGFRADLDNSTFSTTFEQQFTDHHIFFSDIPEVSVQDIGNRWLLSHHQAVTFLVARENNKLNIYGVGRQFWVHADWNEMRIHIPDESQSCLSVGATELFIRDIFPMDNQVPLLEPVQDQILLQEYWIGRMMVLKTTPTDPSRPIRRHLVKIIEVEHTEDPLCPDSESDQAEPPPLPITRIKWEDAQALPFELCLKETMICGNILPATAGETHKEYFVIRENNKLPDHPDVTPAVERQGLCNELTNERSATFMYSLKQTGSLGLGWTGELRDAVPELELQEVDPDTLEPFDPKRYWDYERSLRNSKPFQEHFTLEDGTWRQVIHFQRIGQVIPHIDYANGTGFTIRFGDGEFGQIPTVGTVFMVRYRTGPGTQANLPPDSVTTLVDPNPHPPDEPWPTLDIATAVSNPFAITSGVNPEEPDVIKQLAPEAFQAEPLRAVRDEDYQEIAERLSWVQHAGARARWTGSWLSECVTADPFGSFELNLEQQTELEQTMDCVRQVGREVYVRDPEFLNIDLDITICVEPFAYAGQVKEQVVKTLTGHANPWEDLRFFHPDHFTFGQPLHRAELEAVIQGVPGVRGVERMRIRARGVTDWRIFRELIFEIGDNQIIRLQHDPRFPERGSLRIQTMVETQV